MMRCDMIASACVCGTGESWSWQLAPDSSDQSALDVRWSRSVEQKTYLLTQPERYTRHLTVAYRERGQGADRTGQQSRGGGKNRGDKDKMGV